MLNEIPVMNDPLSKYWYQPKDIRSAPMDDKHVLLTTEQYNKLSKYNSTNPSGVYPGKCWMRINDASYLVWYGEDIKGMCSINYRVVL